jgi:hypothetical protein
MYMKAPAPKKQESASVSKLRSRFPSSKSFLFQIAEAPKLRQVQQVQGLEELESEKLHRLKEYVKNKALSGSYDDTSQIDLSLLMSNLLPEKLIQEPDELWDAELLLTAVASDLQSQSENRAVPHKSKNNN